MISYYLTSLGVIPYFASRAFVPLFTTAALGRFGPEFGPLADFVGIQLLGSMPGWATSNLALLILGLLAVVDIVAAKIPEVRELISLGDSQLKGAAAFLMCFAIVRGNPMEIVGHVEKVGLTTSFASGQSFAYVWSFAIGAVVWFAAVMRNSIFGFLREMDEDDDLGIQGFLSWVEDGIGIFGVLFVVVFPVLALVLVGLTLLGLWLTRRYLEHREQKAKVPCPHCGTPNPSCGASCSSCGQARQLVYQVGLLGSIKDVAVTDLYQHRLQLLSRKRCASCGERLKDRRIAQHCQSCGAKPFGSPEAVEEYLPVLACHLASHPRDPAFDQRRAVARPDSWSDLLPPVSDLQPPVLCAPIPGIFGSLGDPFAQPGAFCPAADSAVRHADAAEPLPAQLHHLSGSAETPVTDRVSPGAAIAVSRSPTIHDLSIYRC